MFSLSDYDYDLPSELIAQNPSEPAESAKLLVCSGDVLLDKHIRDLPEIFTSDDVLFFNDTRVVKARIPLQNVEFLDTTGRRQDQQGILEKGEIFVYKIIDEYHFESIVSDGKHFRPGYEIIFGEGIKIISIEFTKDGILQKVEGITIFELLDQFGQMPLPPYISHEKSKEEYYQTVFAKEEGSVAAPTAGLHFTPQLLDKLQKNGVESHFLTLHVSLGTFKPVDVSDIRDHEIHQETAMVDISLFETIASLILHQKKIVAIGTTSMRVLESLPYVWQLLDHTHFSPQTKEFWGSLSLDQADIIQYFSQNGTRISFTTQIFLFPGKSISIVNSLLTNFHLPKSTLLMLISACIGFEETKKLYNYAIQHNYRFYSFGDACLLTIN